jgi:uncharacterized protein
VTISGVQGADVPGAGAPGATGGRPGRSITAKALRVLILAYQAASFNRRPACRFVPSCSEYALEALQVFGARRGVSLILRRLVRCRPGGPFGLDPVPGSSSLSGVDGLR